MVKVPFEREDLLSVCGGKEYRVWSHDEHPVQVGYFNDLGLLRLEDGSFSISEGTVRVGRPLLRLDAVRVLGGEARLSGQALDRVVSDGGHYETAYLFEAQKLRLEDLGICVSTCDSYFKSTVPYLLRSLRMAGWQDMSSVRLAVSLANGVHDYSTPEGVAVTRLDKNFGGMSGLLAADGSKKYWLLLHDTCAFSDTTLAELREIDVGLRQDIVYLSETGSVGLYRSDFLSGLGFDLRSVPAINLSSKLALSAERISAMQGVGPAIGSTMRVYGGAERNRTYLACGISKFISEEGNRP